MRHFFVVGLTTLAKGQLSNIILSCGQLLALVTVGGRCNQKQANNKQQEGDKNKGGKLRLGEERTNRNLKLLF